MSWLKRLWWRITCSPGEYVDKVRDRMLIDELNTICIYFDLKLEQTKIWEYYDIPYNPIGSLSPEENELDGICRIRSTQRRRTEFYWFMCSSGDIEHRAIRKLECTPEWHDFDDWLKNR
jgi:hypothetical protein